MGRRPRIEATGPGRFVFLDGVEEVPHGATRSFMRDGAEVHEFFDADRGAWVRYDPEPKKTPPGREPDGVEGCTD